MVGALCIYQKWCCSFPGIKSKKLSIEVERDELLFATYIHTYIRCMASEFDQGAREAAAKEEGREHDFDCRRRRRELGHPVPAGHYHELDEPGIDADMHAGASPSGSSTGK